MNEMAVMGKEGDTRIMWNPENDAEVENAQRTFDDLKKKGYLAYAVAKKGDKGEVVRSFDKHAAKLILAPPMAGG